MTPCCEDRSIFVASTLVLSYDGYICTNWLSHVTTKLCVPVWYWFPNCLRASLHGSFRPGLSQPGLKTHRVYMHVTHDGWDRWMSHAGKMHCKCDEFSPEELAWLSTAISSFGNIVRTTQAGRADRGTKSHQSILSNLAKEAWVSSTTCSIANTAARC